MAYEEKDGKGTLFQNDRKEKENHPDYKGTFTLNGEQFEIAGWKKPGKDGKAFLSLSVKPKQERRPAPQGFPTAQPTYSEEIDF